MFPLVSCSLHIVLQLTIKYGSILLPSINITNMVITCVFSLPDISVNTDFASAGKGVQVLRSCGIDP
jgi:hypothetical protein